MNRLVRICAPALLVLAIATPAVAAQVPKPTAPPEYTAVAKKTVYVYKTRTGGKYHRSGCRYLKKSRTKVTLKAAKRAGLKPCKVCKPPK